MERELVELFETAKKAADAAATAEGAADESHCLDALGQLKSFPVTYQLLVSTQVFNLPLKFFIVFLPIYMVFRNI